jgi:hypothetical protein
VNLSGVPVLVRVRGVKRLGGAPVCLEAAEVREGERVEVKVRVGLVFTVEVKVRVGVGVRVGLVFTVEVREGEGVQEGVRVRVGVVADRT